MLKVLVPSLSLLPYFIAFLPFLIYFAAYLIIFRRVRLVSDLLITYLVRYILIATYITRASSKIAIIEVILRL